MPGAEQRYGVYGLTLASHIPLDLEPAPADAPVDVIVRQEQLADLDPQRYPDKASLFAGGTADRLAVRLPGVAAGEVRGGTEIAVQAEAGLPLAALGDFVLQPMLAYLLIQRSYLVLHASCVAIQGRAVAILGVPGAGKSTTAGALAARGHRIVGDDVLAVTAGGSVLPGVTRLKLMPAAAAALGHDPATLEAYAGEIARRRYRPPPAGIAAGPVRLHRAYVLCDGDEPAIVPLGIPDALRSLIVNSYGILAIHDTAPDEHFARLTGLLQRVPVSQLRRPRELARLDELGRLIEADVAAALPAPVDAERA